MRYLVAKHCLTLPVATGRGNGTITITHNDEKAGAILGNYLIVGGEELEQHGNPDVIKGVLSCLLFCR